MVSATSSQKSPPRLRRLFTRSRQAFACLVLATQSIQRDAVRDRLLGVAGSLPRNRCARRIDSAAAASAAFTSPSRISSDARFMETVTRPSVPPRPLRSRASAVISFSVQRFAKPTRAKQHAAEIRQHGVIQQPARVPVRSSSCWDLRRLASAFAKSRATSAMSASARRQSTAVTTGGFGRRASAARRTFDMFPGELLLIRVESSAHRRALDAGEQIGIVQVARDRERTHEHLR